MKSMKVLGMALLGMSIIMASCTGDQGEPGPKGDKGDSVTGGKGDKGDPGKDGLACWDLNGNGMADVDTEDFNNDGEVNALDCQGAPGNDGQDGSDKPNMEFYFQNGYNNYTGTQDARISPLGEADGNDGTLAIREDLENPNLRRFSLLRFDDISDKVNTAFDTDNTNCGDSYRVDQVILYLYAGSSTASSAIPGYIHLGFYEDGDPLFSEADVSWTVANQVDTWGFLTGAGSLWDTNPFPGSDGYTHYMPLITTTSQNMGWIAIPLPRDFVTKWICGDPDNLNKGMRLRLTTEANAGSASITFFSSEHDNVDLRPLLVVQTTEANPATTKMAPSSKAKDWDNMSYEEKMAPLFRYFAAKEAN
ncbi:hypothetical protein [Flagellimonas alvinocaridis]|uniref:hypothetical protein n=1 Tax=Flagellimonas alvinocaridis TaxID=2530200 RepID=UPI00191BEE3F|nr:hypothetical protein [Allomuricauda alvinocaridis]